MLTVLSVLRLIALNLSDSVTTGSVDLSKVQLLKYPQDASTIAQLDLIELQCWYAGQDARQMIYLAQTEDFKRFWKLHYLWPLKAKRFLYKFKTLLSFKIFAKKGLSL